MSICSTKCKFVEVDQIYTQDEKVNKRGTIGFSVLTAFINTIVVDK